MPEGIFHEMHRRRNISPPATTDQALRAAQPKGRPRARLLLKHILLHLIPSFIKDRDNAVWHCLCYEHRGEEAHRWCGQSSVTLQSLPNASIVWTNFHNLAIDKAFVSLDLDKLDSVNFDTKPHCKRKPCLHNSGNLGNIAIWLLRCKTSFGYWVRPSALGSIFCLSKRKGIQ